jgi:coiled-coil domain-containing protein 55
VEEPSGSQPKDSKAAASTEKTGTPQNIQPAKVTDDHYKRGDDALAAARARALARKKAKEQQL